NDDVEEHTLHRNDISSHAFDINRFRSYRNFQILSKRLWDEKKKEQEDAHCDLKAKAISSKNQPPWNLLDCCLKCFGRPAKQCSKRRRNPALHLPQSDF